MGNNSTQVKNDKPPDNKVNNQIILNDAVQWIESQMSKHNYADIGLTLSLHGGKVCKIQKTLMQKFI